MENNNSLNHVVKIVERKNIIISGIKKIVSFDDKQFLLESNMGNIFIKGSNLEMIKLDTIDGNVSIKGTIDSFVYAEDKKVRVITGLKRISKSGLRVYAKCDELPRVLNGLGIAIISTSEGIMTDRDARNKKLGGEVLAYIW